MLCSFVVGDCPRSIHDDLSSVDGCALKDEFPVEQGVREIFGHVVGAIEDTQANSRECTDSANPDGQIVGTLFVVAHSSSLSQADIRVSTTKADLRLC